MGFCKGVFKFSCNSEITDFNFSFGVGKDIGWFDIYQEVEMNDVILEYDDEMQETSVHHFMYVFQILKG